LSTLLQEAIDLACRREALTPAGYARRVQEIENRLDDWLKSNHGRRTLRLELERLDKHIRAHRGEWLVFLHDPEVPPPNNHAEQMWRPAVITRKVGGGNNTLWEALVHGILASSMVSGRRQGKRFLELDQRLWSSSDPSAIDLELRRKTFVHGCMWLEETMCFCSHEDERGGQLHPAQEAPAGAIQPPGDPTELGQKGMTPLHRAAKSAY